MGFGLDSDAIHSPNEPCTERLISTTVATLLRDVGINGLMAFKGQPLVRLTGVTAVNGDGLATQSAPRSGLVVDRGSVHSKTPVKTDWTPEARGGGSVAVSTPMRTEEANDAPAEDTATEPQDNATAQPPAEEAPAAVDDELAALLASLDTPAEPAAEEPAMDPDLEALLKSLG